MNGKYFLHRLGQAVLVVWLAYTLTFVLLQTLPADPVTLYLSRDASASEATIAELKHAYGYDQPPLVQYFTRAAALLHGDLGYSLVAGQPVSQRLAPALGSTLTLALSALAVTLVFAVALAAGATIARWRWLRSVLANTPAVVVCIPVFLLGLVALDLFALKLGWMSLFPDGSALSLLVPVVILALHLSAPIAQLLIKCLAEAYEQPFVTVLRAKGLSEAQIFWRHTLKYAAGPALSITALALGTLLAGSVITETVFSRAGIGQLVLKSVIEQDFPLLQAVVVVTATSFALANLFVDAAHPGLDPRVAAAASRPLLPSLGGYLARSGGAR